MHTNIWPYGSDIAFAWLCIWPDLGSPFPLIIFFSSAAFQTPTGMPYGTVNLLRGVNPTETPVTCTAGVGTFILEFSALSRLTGDPVFEDVARKALRSLWKTRSEIGLVSRQRVADLVL